ncbi:MAG: Collagenase and Endostatin [Myxococcales bacterium]|nr:Collagenase and Endostatin [Myxococcales bacterium]
MAKPAGMIGGTAGADDMCAQSATDAGLPGHYRAWISTAGMPALLRLGSARGWTRLDGLPFADTIGDLVAGRIFNPLRLDERATDVGDGGFLVATGTHDDGQQADNCNDFTGGATGLFGDASATKGTWTEAAVHSCTEVTRLYCFGTDLRTPVAQPTETGRLAFLTNSNFSPSGGLAKADELCNTEAHTTDRFAALLSTTKIAAGSRFSSGTPWVRPDHVLVTRDLNDFPAPINVTLDGGYVQSAVWTGAGATNSTSGGIDESCNDWTSSDATSTAAIGASESSGRHVFFYSTMFECNQPRPIYCLER